MSIDKYITISQYAKLKGITPQAVYKQLNTSLKDHVLLVDGKKYIDTTSLNLSLNSNDDIDTVCPNEVVQPLPTVEQPNNTTTDVLLSTIDFLKTQIEIKDNQIAELQQQNKEQANIIQEQMTKFTSLLENSQQLINQSQVLQLADKAEEPKTRTLLQRIFFRNKDNKNEDR